MAIADAVWAFRNTFAENIQVLQEYIDDDEQTVESVGLLNGLTKFEIVFPLEILGMLFDLFQLSSIILQKSGLALSNLRIIEEEERQFSGAFI